jgi:hypothetical protein
MSGWFFYYITALLSGTAYYAVWKLHVVVGPMVISERDVYAFVPGIAAVISAVTLRWPVVMAGPVKTVLLSLLFTLQVTVYSLLLYIPFDWVWRFISSIRSPRGLSLPSMVFPGGFFNYLGWQAPRLWEVFWQTSHMTIILGVFSVVALKVMARLNRCL